MNQKRKIIWCSIVCAVFSNVSLTFVDWGRSFETATVSLPLVDVLSAAIRLIVAATFVLLHTLMIMMTNLDEGIMLVIVTVIMVVVAAGCVVEGARGRAWNMIKKRSEFLFRIVRRCWPWLY